MTTRVCTTCKTEKPIEEYARDRRKALGRRFQCKACVLKVKDVWKAKRRKDTPTLQAILRDSRVQRLIKAAAEARSTGDWRQSAGLRAYAELGRALELLGWKEPEDDGGIVFYDADRELFGDDRAA